MWLRRFSLLAILLVYCVSFAVTQDIEVDREELRSQAGATIEFQNFQGPQDQVSSAEEILGIGRLLSEGVEGEPGAEADYFDRYTLFRGVDPNDPDGLDADVLSINQNAAVNHIDNVRRIIAGYLIDAFGYSRADANLVAELTTIYNAVYRGNMEFFTGRYKKIVSDYLETDRAGISTNYVDWPGGTQLVIPLSSGREPGDLDAVSPLQLADPAVIEDLRQRRDMGIETRKDMIAFIERVIEERQEEIEEERAAIEEERQQIEERQEQIAEERQQLDEEEAQQEQAVADQEPAAEEAAPEDETGDDETVQAAADEQAEEPEQDTTTEERRQQLEEEEEQLAEQEAELQEREEELAEEEEEVEELTERVQELYDETSEDQEQVIEEQGRQEEAAAAEPVLFFIVDSSGESGRLALVDRRNGDLLAEYAGSPLRRGSFSDFQGGVIALEASGRQETTALLLDEESLQPVVSANREVYRRSTVTVRGDAAYMVLREEGSWRVGRFSGELELEEISVVAVEPDSDIVISEGRLLIQSPDGEVLLLDSEDLRITR